MNHDLFTSQEESRAGHRERAQVKEREREREKNGREIDGSTQEAPSAASSEDFK